MLVGPGNPSAISHLDFGLVQSSSSSNGRINLDKRRAGPIMREFLEYFGKSFVDYSTSRPHRKGIETRMMVLSG